MLRNQCHQVHCVSADVAELLGAVPAVVVVVPGALDVLGATVGVT